MRCEDKVLALSTSCSSCNLSVPCAPVFGARRTLRLHKDHEVLALKKLRLTNSQVICREEDLCMFTVIDLL